MYGFALILVLGLGEHLVAQTAAQEAKERQVMQAVAAFLERAHISGQVLDNEVSSRALDSYLESLDPMKQYFLESDVDAFRQRRRDIDDMLRAGDTRFANRVFGRLLQRIDERVEVAKTLVGEEHDFTLLETFTVDPEQLDYAVDTDASRERWRKRVKYDLLRMTDDGVSDEEARDRVLRRYVDFRDRMRQSDRNDVLSAFLNAVTTTYDPHTNYLSPKGFEDLEMSLTLNYQGIGALLQERDGYAHVERIMPGGAAEADGRLKAGDRIISVGQGKDGELVDVVGMRLPDVVKLIRGEEGSRVRLGVLPAGSSESVMIELIRARTELMDSAASGQVIEVGETGSPLKVGVIDLPSFYVDDEGAREERPDYKSSTRDTRKLLEGFKSQGVDVVILDLRSNGGGLLSEAVSVTGLFIDRGPVVQIKQFDGTVRVLNDRDGGMAWDGPLVVLTSRLSASASEIVAGAIADYQRGLTVGDGSTHGKGTVQTVIGLGSPENGALKLTVQQFYRPSGLSTQRRGVAADVELPSLTNGMAEGEDALPNALPFSSIDSVDHSLYGMVSPSMAASLQAESESRTSQSEVFSAIRDDIALYTQLNGRTEVSLNLDEFRSMQEELKSSRARQRELDALITASGSDLDAYLSEVIAIAEDYLALLRG